LNAAALSEMRALKIHGWAFAGISALLVLVWARTSHSSFWPQHALQPLALTLLAHAWFVLVSARPTVRQRTVRSDAFAIHLGIAGALWLYLVVMWAMAPGYFWPLWPLLGLAVAAGVHAAIDRVEPGAPDARAEGASNGEPAHPGRDPERTSDLERE
jgi:hypothetical protein